MSFYLLNQLRCCRSRFTSQRLNQSAHRLFCSNNNNSNGNDRDTNSTITNNNQKNRFKTIDQHNIVLIQQGTEIHELPIILKQCDQNDVITLNDNKIDIENFNNDNNGFQFDTTTHNIIIENGDILLNPLSYDIDNILLLLKKSNTPISILQIINDLTENELEPDILQYAINKIYENGTHDSLQEIETNNDTYHELIKLLCKKCNNETLMDLLTKLKWKLYLNKTIDMIGTELAYRNSDSCLTIIEICETIDKLTECERNWIAEKFWCGFADQESLINENNIKFIFETLPKLKCSRRTIVKILDRVMENVFPLMKTDAVCDTLNALKICKNGHTKTIIQTITCWLNTNIHSLNENQLEHIINCLNQLPFSDAHVEMSIERYVKAKSGRIKSQTLIVEIAHHTSLYRLRNTIILNGIADYLIDNIDRIDPNNIRNIFRPFGLAYFQPINAMQFWTAFEKYLNKYFYKIPPADIVDLLLEAILLEMFPKNHIERIFTRYFMHQLHSIVPIDRLPFARQRLQLIDGAMALEIKNFDGPILPRDSNNIIKIDNRIKCLLNDNNDIIETIAGNKTLYTTMTMFKELPHNNLYIIDLLFHPPGMGALLKLHSFDSKFDYGGFTAALIHLPEHYDSRQQHLIGAQRMRIRHLRKLGLKVASLNYELMRKLSTHKIELHQYFVEQMKNALLPLNKQ